MTAEKAIGLISGLNITYSWADEKDECDAIDKAVEVLEKQVPKKPVRTDYALLTNDGWEFVCPECRCAVGINRFREEITQEDEYCSSCGQRLEW